LIFAGSAARCAIGGGHRVQAHPPSGCAFWERELGSDDEDGPPATLDAQSGGWPAGETPLIEATLSE
jgi:hypothetical protein